MSSRPRRPSRRAVSARGAVQSSPESCCARPPSGGRSISGRACGLSARIGYASIRAWPRRTSRYARTVSSCSAAWVPRSTNRALVQNDDQSCTRIVIAHRLSTIRDADLMAQDGAYSRLTFELSAHELSDRRRSWIACSVTASRWLVASSRTRPSPVATTSGVEHWWRPANSARSLRVLRGGPTKRHVAHHVESRFA
jgi:hypothetical protein